MEMNVRSSVRVFFGVKRRKMYRELMGATDRQSNFSIRFFQNLLEVTKITGYTTM